MKLFRSEIWMPHGDLVLMADAWQFKVNGDVLARHSSVFRAMLSLPQPIYHPTVDGCPVAHLSDSYKDVELILTAFYNPFHHKHTQPFKTVASMLRMGNKYEIFTFQNDALSRMHYEFPTDLETWDRLPAQLEQIEEGPGVYVDLLALAYENGVYTCIPTIAFTCLDLYTMKEIFDGIPRGGGPGGEILPDHVKLTLALGVEKIRACQQENLECIRNWFKDFDHQCDRECLIDLFQDRGDYDAMMFQAEDVNDLSYVMDPWDRVGAGRWRKRLCKECEKQTKKKWDIRRNESWNKLPTFFGLPEWTDLVDD
ncbi:hypothetical protein C8R43DRAFT_879459 [Mycena crocata]|nr:hypothetical protein C8R43DRAFT_879459 [Mycena crocata]